LFAAGADFIIVGAHAVMRDALRKFGAPLDDLGVEDLSTPGMIFQIGIASNRIDIITAIDGVDFDAAWQRRELSTYGEVPIAILAIEDLLTNKRTAC
jgi:hypothetical protein